MLDLEPFTDVAGAVAAERPALELPLLELALVMLAVGPRVVDHDARLGDVVLLVVGEERERVPAVGDVLGALPVERAEQGRGEARAVVVADQFAVDLQPDPEDAVGLLAATWIGSGPL